MNGAPHWEAIYRGRATEDLGWYEPRPSTLDLVLRFSDPADALIDIGAGDSRLVDELVEAGYQDITVLDLSDAALDRAQTRLGSAAPRVSRICADVTRWTPPRRWQVWHDRAVFHFLIDDEGQQAYKRAALDAIPAGGKLIVITFAPDGPNQCAGLPVKTYAAVDLAAVFAPEFALVEHQHLKPSPTTPGDSRPYVAVVLERS